MSPNALSKLTLGVMPSTGSGADPKITRRNNVIKRLLKQKELLKNPDFTRTIRKRGDDGKLTESQQKVLPAWAPVPGGYAFGLRLTKRLEFAPGKTAVTVTSIDKLPAVIDTLVAAVRSGELDGALEAAAQKPVAQKKGGAKKAA
jgi:hypothetical protein